MNSLKLKWDELTTPIKAAVGAGVAIVGVIFVLKVLPALVAAMGIGALLAILFIPYWIPTIIAFLRKHPSKLSILAVNFFFGWTFIGWVLSLVWALSDNSSRTQSVVVNTTVSPTFMVGNSSMAPAPEYRIGDVVNGHRYNGAEWQREPSSPLAPYPPKASAGPNH